MLTKLRKQNQGFTIIEVLIVLAIAGLILLIVFLAVPALQRNSRNTQRRNDVSKALGAAQEVLNNNNGLMSALDTAALQGAMGTPSYYDVTKITVGTGALPADNSTTTTTAVMWKDAKCNATGGTLTGGNTRQVAILYRVEPDVPQCQDS